MPSPLLFYFSIILALTAFAPPASAQSTGAPRVVNVSVNPRQPLVELMRDDRQLNFDFILENTSADELRLTNVEVSVFDARGRLVLRKFAGSGVNSAPSIRITLAAKNSALLYNPFYSFSTALPLERLRYEFTFAPTKEGDEREFRSESEISPRVYAPKTDLILPVAGRVLNYEGHDYYAHHRRVDLLNPVVHQLGVKSNPTLYAYDFCVVNAEGALYRGAGKRNADWYGLGAGILAPGAGRVLEAENNVADNVLGGQMFDFSLVFKNIKAFYGNYVIIDHLNGEYSLLAHLQHGSVRVRAGERVRQGQLIARMGISGDADNVHLHYQLQNGIGLDMQTLPSYFRNFRLHGGARPLDIARGAIASGEIVESRAQHASSRR